MSSRILWLGAVISLNLQCVRLSARIVTSRGVRSLSKSSINPMLSALRCARSITASSLCASRNCASAASARPKKLWPAGVRRMGRLPWSIRSVANAVSRLRNCWLTAGWLRPVTAAACATDPVEASASNTSKPRRVTPLLIIAVVSSFGFCETSRALGQPFIELLQSLSLAFVM